MTTGPTQLRVLYPGSFDPIHLGHVDIIEQAHELFGSIVVAVMHNLAKPSGLFPVDERVELARAALAHLEHLLKLARAMGDPDSGIEEATTFLIEARQALSAFEEEDIHGEEEHC